MAEITSWRAKPEHRVRRAEWADPPACCRRMTDALEDGVILAGADTAKGRQFYIMPLGPEGAIYNKNGVFVDFCPWCGVAIASAKDKTGGD